MIVLCRSYWFLIAFSVFCALPSSAQTVSASADSLYDQSLSTTEMNMRFFPTYLEYVEQNPTAERLKNLATSRAATLDRYVDDVVATAKRIRIAHPELSPAVDLLLYPNREPAVPYVVGEWMTEFDLLRQVEALDFQKAKERLFQKASPKGIRSYETSPQIGGFKNGPGGNQNFQTALVAFIESTFYGRRKPLDKAEFLRFVTMVTDVETRQNLFVGFVKRSQILRVRCENLFQPTGN